MLSNAIAKAAGESWDKLYAVYDVISGLFSYFDSEQEALMDMKPKGTARVVSAAPLRLSCR